LKPYISNFEGERKMKKKERFARKREEHLVDERIKIDFESIVRNADKVINKEFANRNCNMSDALIKCMYRMVYPDGDISNMTAFLYDPEILLTGECYFFQNRGEKEFSRKGAFVVEDPITREFIMGLIYR